MSVRKNVRKLTHRQLKEVAALCSGVALLVGVALTLSGSVPFLPQSLKVAIGNINQTVTANAAAVPYWSGIYTSNGGYPNPLVEPGWVSAAVPGNYGCGDHWCSQSVTCSNPFIAVISVSDSSGISGGAARTQINGATSQSGIGVTTSGGPIRLDWACQPYNTIRYINNANRQLKCTQGGTPGDVTRYYATNAKVAGPAGSTIYNGTNLIGSATVTVNGNVGDTKNYTLTCSGTGTWVASISVKIVALPPTVSILGNGTNPTVVIVGKPVNILGTFVAATGDTLLQTALNDYQGNPLPGVAWTPPTNKTYIFTPQAPGNYLFYPAVRTTSYPDPWNNYGKSLTVTAQCPDHSINKGGSCVCDSSTFYVAQGGSCALSCPANSNPTSGGTCQCTANATMVSGVCTCGQFYKLEGGSCALHCPVNSSPTSGGSCLCGPGFAMEVNSCVLVDACLNIPDAQAAAPAHGSRDAATGNCNCDSGFTLKAGQCVVDPKLDIKVNGLPTARVRSGSSATVTWTTSNVTPGSCAVSDSSGTTIASGTDNNPTPAPAETITRKTIFTLRCADMQGDPHSVSATVNLIPAVKEL